MSYSMYAYVEAFINEKQKAWITAHVHMYEYFGGVPKILVPDNCLTAVYHIGDWYTPSLNTTYHELAEHYGTAIIPARVRKPKDKPGAEGTVRNVSAWITAALRNEQFNANTFQKKEGSRRSLFLGEEMPLLASLPATCFELCEWKVATVQFNYHVAVEKMYYSVPYQYIKNKVDVRITDGGLQALLHSKVCAAS